jgi:hypothetical protein
MLGGTMKSTLRYIVYCPPQYRKPPVFGCGPLLATGEHSRPVYRVLDRAKLAKGNNPETPEHTTAQIVKDGLTYLDAMKKAAKLNAAPFAQKIHAAAQYLRDNDCETLADAKRVFDGANKLLRVARNLEYMLGTKNHA